MLYQRERDIVVTGTCEKTGCDKLIEQYETVKGQAGELAPGATGPGGLNTLFDSTSVTLSRHPAANMLIPAIVRTAHLWATFLICVMFIGRNPFVLLTESIRNNVT